MYEIFVFQIEPLKLSQENARLPSILFLDSLTLATVEPQFHEVSRDWGNLFVISRFCSIHFTVTLAGLKNNYRSLYRGLHYIEVR